MIEICSHCWAGTLPQYAALLRYQLSSLVLYPSQVRVGITVCYCPEDEATKRVLLDFLERTDWGQLRLNVVPLGADAVGRRSIGRNLVAKRTEADLVWFADVDMVFREGCLDTLWDFWLADEHKPKMYWVPELWIHKTHGLGDRAIEAADGSQMFVDIDPDEFQRTRYSRAIGGVQIVTGDTCREQGYLDEYAKWQQPRTDGHPFKDFRDDVVFRKRLREQGPFKEVQVPELYRIRHSKTTYQ